MSASTVSITGNPSAATRRRHVEKKSTDVIDFSSEPNNFAGPAADKITVGADASIRTEGPVTSRDGVVQVRKPLPGSTTTARRTTTAAAATATSGRKPNSKVLKPWWMTVISVLSKNLFLLLVLLGLVQIVRQLMLKNVATPGIDLVPGDYKGNMEKVEEFMRSTTKSMKMMQVQVDVLDRKIGDEIGSVKRDVGEKIEAKGQEIEAKLKELDGRTLNFESFMGDLRARMGEWLSKEELNEFIEEIKKTNNDGDSVTLDEVRAFAREIVEREIEKHAADGIGRVDYALGRAGGLVLKYSDPFAAGNGWIPPFNARKVSPDAQTMVLPSFGEPGQCFPLKGTNGFVQIKLRTEVIPEAVTLEHVAESVAYDRSSAPKDCRVSGWLENGVPGSSVSTEKMVLTEFMYDLGKRNIQTFDVVDSARSSVVNMINFEFASNHGNPNHTCIYRIRVHGRDPHSVLLSKMQS